MLARTIEIYLLPSLTEIIGDDPVRLVEEVGRHARLTKSAKEAVEHLRRRNACGALLASSFMGGGSPDQSARRKFDDILSGPGGQITVPDDGVLLVVECETELPDAPLGPLLDLGDLALALGVGAAGGIEETARGVMHAALTAVALAGFDGLLDDGRSLGTTTMVIESGSDRSVYIVEPKIGFTMTSKSALLPEQAAKAARLASTLNLAPSNLRHIPRLLAQSHAERLRPLSAFISAWAALEMLVATTFQQYEATMAQAVEGALPVSARTVALRMRTVMKDKYRLTDKFAMMASALNPVDAEDDIASFAQLKDMRDAFFHKLEADPADLPADGTRRLLRKYLTLHLTRTATKP